MSKFVEGQNVFVAYSYNDTIIEAEVAKTMMSNGVSVICVKRLQPIVCPDVYRESEVFDSREAAEAYLTEKHTAAINNYKSQISNMSDLIKFCVAYMEAAEDYDAIAAVKQKAEEFGLEP